MNRVFAPWTAEEVVSLNDYQACDFFHEFTGTDGVVLIATSGGWIEKEGGPVVQDWAYDFMANGSWRETVERLRQRWSTDG
jgi:hypothetical protein